MKEKDNEKIILDQAGYENYLKAIAEKEKELDKIRMYKGKVAIYQGDNWHDNPILYQTELKENSIMTELANMRAKLNNIEIVEGSNIEDVINISDIVEIELIYSDTDIERTIIRLVGTMPKKDEISIESPIGSAIYQKKVGDTENFKVNGNVFKVVIIRKLTEKDLEAENKVLKR